MKRHTIRFGLAAGLTLALATMGCGSSDSSDDRGGGGGGGSGTKSSSHFQSPSGEWLLAQSGSKPQPPPKKPADGSGAKTNAPSGGSGAKPDAPKKGSDSKPTKPAEGGSGTKTG